MFIKFRFSFTSTNSNFNVNAKLLVKTSLMQWKMVFQEHIWFDFSIEDAVSLKYFTKTYFNTSKLNYRLETCGFRQILYYNIKKHLTDEVVP